MSEIENPAGETLADPAAEAEVTPVAAVEASPAVEAEATPAAEADATPAAEADAEAEAKPAEDISYHAVEKDGQVTALWEMQGRRHLRTIDPRSREGLAILQHYTSDHHDEVAAV